MAFVPERPVRVKITYPDGSWAKVTVPRVPEEDEWAEGESVEVLEDEPGYDVYGGLVEPEYGGTPTEKPTKKAAAKSEEAPK